MSPPNLEICCRLCAQEQDVTIMLFSQEAQALHLENKLNKYLLIEVHKDDNLPKNICIQCCTKLQTVCEFIDTARKAQEDLISRCSILNQIKTEPQDSDDDSKHTQMEVSVDPMMVLENQEGPLSDDNNSNAMEDVRFLHGVDGENVTIKLIKNPGTPQREESPEKKPFPCITCDRSFCSELALKNHIWTHLPESKLEKQYKCETCYETFRYRYDLVSHLKRHQCAGACQLCGRVFRSDKTYQAHMSVHLPSHRSYTCKVCNRSYNTWGGLKTHMVTHSTERPYKCTYCKKTFKRKQDLKFHINQHTGARPYKCPYCDKCFASSGNCYSHRSRMHPGKDAVNKRRITVKKTTKDTKEAVQFRPIAPKPENSLVSINGIYKYQCNVCEHSFLKKENYTYHMYQHTGEKPFKCTLCSAKFVTRRGLLLHHDKVHDAKKRPLALLSKNELLK